MKTCPHLTVMQSYDDECVDRNCLDCGEWWKLARCTAPVDVDDLAAFAAVGHEFVGSRCPHPAAGFEVGDPFAVCPVHAEWSPPSEDRLHAGH